MNENHETEIEFICYTDNMIRHKTIDTIVFCCKLKIVEEQLKFLF